MNKLNIIENENGKEAVLCSQLFRGLELEPKHYSRWIKNEIINNPFAIENEDFTALSHQIDVIRELKPTFGIVEGKRTRNKLKGIDFVLSLDFAKHLAMRCRTEKGHEIRKYFLECEKVAKTKTNSYLLELQTELNAWRGLERIRLQRIELNREVRELKTTTANPSKKNFTDFTNQLTLNFN